MFEFCGTVFTRTLYAKNLSPCYLINTFHSPGRSLTSACPFWNVVAGLKKRRFIIGSLLTTPKPGKQPLCHIKVVEGPGKFNPFRLHPLWQNEPFHNQCKLILTFDIDHRQRGGGVLFPPPTTTSFSPQLWDGYCNFAGHLIRYLVHHKSIVISKKGGWLCRGGGGGLNCKARQRHQTMSKRLHPPPEGLILNENMSSCNLSQMGDFRLCVCVLLL